MCPTSLILSLIRLGDSISSQAADLIPGGAEAPGLGTRMWCSWEVRYPTLQGMAGGLPGLTRKLRSAPPPPDPQDPLLDFPRGVRAPGALHCAPGVLIPSCSVITITDNNNNNCNNTGT